MRGKISTFTGNNNRYERLKEKVEKKKVDLYSENNGFIQGSKGAKFILNASMEYREPYILDSMQDR